MRTSLAILLSSIATALISSQCRANLNGDDFFNGNSKDTNRWGADFLAGVGFLSETNGRLQFTTTNVPTSSDKAGWPWTLNYGSYTQDWEIHLDVNVSQITLSPTGSVTFGLLVYPGTNQTMIKTNRFIMQLDQTTTALNFVCDLATSSMGVTNVATLETTSTSAAVRIAFDATTKTLSAFYDEDGPSCGYSWKLLGSTNIPPDWSMTSGSVFGVFVLGSAKNTSVAASNNVFGDNFYASSGMMPRLEIKHGNGSVVISWPTNSPASHLDSASALTPPVCWQVPTNTPVIVSTNFTVTNAISSGNTFYRLSR